MSKVMIGHATVQRNWFIAKLNIQHGVPIRTIAPLYGMTFQRVQQLVARCVQQDTFYREWCGSDYVSPLDG